MKLLTAVAALALFAGCSNEPPSADDVDWSRYSYEWGQAVREAAKVGDCGTLNRAYSAAIGADDGELADWLEHVQGDKDCPGDW